MPVTNSQKIAWGYRIWRVNIESKNTRQILVQKGDPCPDKGLMNTDTGLQGNRTFDCKSTWQEVLSVSLEYHLEVDHVSWSGESMLDLRSRASQKFVFRWFLWKSSLTNDSWVTCYEICWGQYFFYCLGWGNYTGVLIRSKYDISEMTLNVQRQNFYWHDWITLESYWQIFYTKCSRINRWDYIRFKKFMYRKQNKAKQREKTTNRL